MKTFYVKDVITSQNIVLEPKISRSIKITKFAKNIKCGNRRRQGWIFRSFLLSVCTYKTHQTIVRIFLSSLSSRIHQAKKRHFGSLVQRNQLREIMNADFFFFGRKMLCDSVSGKIRSCWVKIDSHNMTSAMQERSVEEVSIDFFASYFKNNLIHKRIILQPPSPTLLKWRSLHFSKLFKRYMQCRSTS